ncbi:sterol regulatory element-binding ECM22 [Fusarium phyllophilum]|uniref:Sterol regulatory element-binding ECM22 n=1 Tax=Fusarium phyllophilum TaxID=47803 RepID=A0A8H5IWY7_9HYPO|nr:sterol regulatory element-binding ECM22 [Fusarium phyllophilum]
MQSIRTNQQKRRTHTKSRTGCDNLSSGVAASLAGGLTARPSSASSAAIPQQTCVQHNEAPTNPRRHSCPTEPLAPLPLDELWRCRLALMHHYCTETATTLSLRQDLVCVWQTAVPTEGYRYSFVTNGVLAIAAAHKAYTNSDDQEIYLKLSDYHAMIGSESFRSELQSLQDENWKSFFAFAYLLVLYSLSRMSIQEPEDPINSLFELISLVRGIKYTLTPMLFRIRSSEFAPLSDSIWPKESRDSRCRYPFLESTCLPPGLWNALTELRHFLAVEVPIIHRDQYRKAVDRLEDTAALISLAGGNAESSVFIVWLCEIDDIILADLAARKSHAFVLLAYFCVFLVGMGESFWYACGWASYLFKGIETALQDQTQLTKLLKWPKACIYKIEI